MKKIFSALLLLMVALVLVSCGETEQGSAQTLYVYNWGEYISDGSDDSLDVVKEFEALTGINVEYTTFDSNESLFAKLKSGSASYDVIIPSDYMVARLAEAGMLHKLDYSNIPNFDRYIDEIENLLNGTVVEAQTHL